MDKYIIHSFEHLYEGLHGIESYLFVQDDLKRTEEIARDESYAIMENYSCVIDSIDEIVEELFNDCEGHPHSYEETFNEFCEKNVAYNIYAIRDDCPLTEQQINKAVYSNPKEFIEEYCDLIISC